MINDRETHQATGIAVDDGGQVHIRPIRNPQVRDITDMDPIWLLRGEFPSHQVREYRLLPLRHGGGGDLAFLQIAEQCQRAHDPGDFIVIDQGAARVVFEFGCDTFGAVAAAFFSEHHRDPDTEKRVVHQAFVPGRRSFLPFTMGRRVEFQYLA